MAIGGKEECHPELVTSRDLPTVVLNSLRKFADRTFLVDGLLDVKRTFEEVHDDAVALARALSSLGLGEGSYVAVLSDPTVEAYTFEIAVWLAGGTVNPINFTLTSGEIGDLLVMSTADFVYCDVDKIPTFEASQAIINRKIQVITNGNIAGYHSLGELLKEQQQIMTKDDMNRFMPAPYHPDTHLAFLLFSSGTTGSSKGVQISSNSALLLGCRAFGRFGTSLTTSPLYWITNPAALMHCLLKGCTLVFPRTKYLPGTTSPDLSHILKCIEKYKPNHWLSCPTTTLELCALAEVGKYDLSSIEHVSIGGSNSTPAQRKLIADTMFRRNVVQNRYGSTEVGFLTRAEFPPFNDQNDPKITSLGQLTPGATLKVLDETSGQELGPNQVGELLVRCDSIMRGYINKEFPEQYTKDDWYRIGDVGYYDDDGWIYFKSRSKEMIKYRCIQVAPMDVEKAVVQHPAVANACVVGRPHPVDGELPTAFVIHKPNVSVSEQELTDFVAERVSDEKKLRGGVIFVKSFPLNSVGKLLRRKLVQSLEEAA